MDDNTKTLLIFGALGVILLAKTHFNIGFGDVLNNSESDMLLQEAAKGHIIQHDHKAFGCSCPQ